MHIYIKSLYFWISSKIVLAKKFAFIILGFFDTNFTLCNNLVVKVF